MNTISATATGQLSPAWRRCIGTGRANLSLRSEFRDALAMAQAEIGFEHIRGHGLLGDDMGLLRESQGTRRMGYRYLDQVFDTYLELGIKPVLELGFMPELLASGDQTLFWWRGNVTPPREQSEWAALVRDLLRHLVARYGAAEVTTWPIEVWNEPNHPNFWENADQAAYFQLYETAALAAKEVDADFRVGGPALQPGGDPEGWLAAFAEHCQRRDVPADFISSHAYGSGPVAPVPFGARQRLYAPADLLRQFGMPRRVLAGTGLADRPVWITEFNTSYVPDNPIHDTAYNACWLAPVLAEGGDVCDAFSYWTLCDTFEEKGIAPSFFHGGFGLLADRCVAKPTYNLYRFFSLLGPDVLGRGEDHLVTRHPDGRLAILAWQPLGGSDEGRYGSAPEGHTVALDLPWAAGQAAGMVRQRVNETQGNSWTAWQDLGCPAAPSLRQLDVLAAAGSPALSHETLVADPQGRVRLELSLDRHEVTLVELMPRDGDPFPVDPAELLGLE